MVLEPNTLDSGFGGHSRFALVSALLAIDTESRPEIANFVAAGTAPDYVGDILSSDTCKGAWDAFLKHQFPRDLAKGATPLNGFRHYMIQDATHFEYFYRARTKAIAEGDIEELKKFSKILPRGLDAVEKARKDCTTKLGVPENIVKDEKISEELKKFIEFVTQIARNGDYLDTIIALLPGVLAYDIITNELVRDASTAKNTVYYTQLILPWSKNQKNVQTHRDYINSHIASLPDDQRTRRWQGWLDNFKKGCEYEVEFSGLASPGKFPAYNIVSDGLYTIRSSKRGKPYLVADSESSVTTQEAQPNDEGRWKLLRSPDGYSIINVKQEQRFLRTDIPFGPQPNYTVYLSPLMDYGFKWSINLPEVQWPEPQPRAFQLSVSGVLQYVVNAGDENANPKVVVSDNTQSASQVWLLEPVLVPGEEHI